MTAARIKRFHHLGPGEPSGKFPRFMTRRLGVQPAQETKDRLGSLQLGFFTPLQYALDQRPLNAAIAEFILIDALRKRRQGELENREQRRWQACPDKKRGKAAAVMIADQPGRAIKTHAAEFGQRGVEEPALAAQQRAKQQGDS